MGYRIAVVGGTGAVGREILKVLAQRNFAIDEIFALASPRSTGRKVSFGEEKILTVNNLESFDFKGIDISFFSPGAVVSSTYAPRAASHGSIVIDNTSHFRMDPDVPLVVPEINAHALKKMSRGIIANPNCSTIQMVMALKPLHDAYKITRVVVATYQATAGTGQSAMNELLTQTRKSLVGDPIKISCYPKQIAFNCIPQIDRFMEDGSTKEEWKMATETRKILDKNIAVFATCVRVPVFIGHAEAISVEFERKVNLAEARQLLQKMPGVALLDQREDGGYATQLDCVGEDVTFVSRVRIDPTVPNGLGLWCVSDNLRKGAALNAVQIAETLVSMNILKHRAK